MKSSCVKFQVFWLKMTSQWRNKLFSLWYMGILTFRHCDVKLRSCIKFFINLNSGPKNNPLYQIWALSSNYVENNSSFFCFFNAENDLHTVNKRLLWQHLIRMVIGKICKIKVRKLLFDISWNFGVMEEKLQGGIPPLPLPAAWMGLRCLKSLKLLCNFIAFRFLMTVLRKITFLNRF